MKILLLDNYDSFTYNIVDALRQLGVEPDVRRNDCITIDEVDTYDRIILSPGPGIPEEAGLLLPVIHAYAGRKPILGVCLGHQAIAQAMGATLINLPKVYHGLQLPATVTATDDYLFESMPQTFPVGRYHSWAVDPGSLPDELEVTATDAEGNIMALRHRSMDLRGVQFHPESIMTPDGLTIFRNWINHGTLQTDIL